MKTIITHIDISPKQDKRCCHNCTYFVKFGVHLGYCTKKNKDMIDRQRCKLFETKIDKK